MPETYGITHEDIYNAYTGDGGLHGLECGDYENYHQFSEAKKEIENGQFFTPPHLCEFVTTCLKPSCHDLIADLTCGKGDFFNFMPQKRTSTAVSWMQRLPGWQDSFIRMQPLNAGIYEATSLKCGLTMWWATHPST